jgi:hypothetical protein
VFTGDGFNSQMQSCSRKAFFGKENLGDVTVEDKVNSVLVGNCVKGKILCNV